MARNQQEHIAENPKQSTSAAAEPQQQPCRFCDAFRRRLAQQQEDLRDLMNVRANHVGEEVAVRQLVATTMQHYLDYSRVRASIAGRDAPSVCSPTCSSTFANSYLWLGGCRPSTIIRLVYLLSGEEVESRFAHRIRGLDVSNLTSLSRNQIIRINELQGTTVRHEETLSSQMASLQEAMADQPLIGLARSTDEASSSVGSGSALESYAGRMARLVEEADKLCLHTLARMMQILTLTQTLELLIAAAQLHTVIIQQGQK